MYLLDSNVLIEAKNRYYAFDIVPAFWDWLVLQHGAAQVFTVQKVVDEVVGTGDELSTWVSDLPAPFSIDIEATDQPHLSSLAQWANAGHFTPAAVSDFLQAADYFLVAQAARLGYTVVTHERADPASKRRIKIPDACKAMQVSYVTPFTMLRAEGAVFTL